MDTMRAMGLEELLKQQDGVVSRRQLLALGMKDAEIARRLRRREWARLLPGVFVNHTGPPTWRQRAIAAVLFHWPAALAGASALHAAGVRGYEPSSTSPIEVCVDRRRSVRRHVGVHVRQVVRFESLCLMQLMPPRQRNEHALLDVASRRPRLDGSVAVLADGVQGGYTTAPRLRSALALRTRLRHRGLLSGILEDVDAGVRSVLEHRYLTWVERAHGLPEGRRQRRVKAGSGSTRRDVEYLDFGVTVELDGVIGHDESADVWDDLDRDIATLVSGEVTLRAGWRQVLDFCRLARAVASVLQARGWTGDIRPCGPDCAAFTSPGEEDVAQTG
jgi:hypothetical protein